MAVVVKWREDGEYLASMYHEQGSPRMGWNKDRSAAIRFESAKEAARCWRKHTGGDPFGVAFVRLVSKRRAEAAETAKVTHGGVTVTAPETMTLGEVWAALSSAPALRVCLDGEKRRAHADGVVEGLRRAQVIVVAHCKDPLRREVDEEIATWIEKASANIATTDRRPAVIRSAPCAGRHQDIDPCDGCAEAYALNPGASEVPADAGMRIERRADGEWLVNAYPGISGCKAPAHGGGCCTQHLNGEHLCTGPFINGAEQIYARWPITPAQDTRAATDAGGGP